MATEAEKTDRAKRSEAMMRHRIDPIAPARIRITGKVADILRVLDWLCGFSGFQEALRHYQRIFYGWDCERHRQLRGDYHTLRSK